MNYSIIVIGAGAGGLVVALGAAKAGKKVLLIEQGTYGGDCTNFGCIPSKSLIASSHASHALSEGEKLGLAFSSKQFEAQKSLERVRRIVEEVRSHEDAAALEKQGVKTLTGLACFIDEHTLKVQETNGGSQIVSGSNIVIATGSSPRIPMIDGLLNTPFLTNETLFDLKDIPKSLAILGGGPIGCELAQAFLRLGTKVTLIHTHKELLAKEEAPAQAIIAEQFLKEGMHLKLGYQTQKIEYSNQTFTLHMT